MATKTYSHSWSLSGDYGMSQPTTISSSTIASFVAANIPPYSTINSVKVKIKNVYQKIALGDSKGDWLVRIGSSGKIGTEVYRSNESITKTSQTLTSSDIKSYFKSGTSDAGALSSGNDFVTVELLASVTRPWYVNGVDIIWDYTPRTYTITASGTNGTVTGGGTYNYNSTAKLTATPNEGYKFVKWSDGNTSNPRTVTVTANATYTAVFEKKTYTITVVVAPSPGGTVSLTSQTVEHGATATATAKYNVGYKFDHWLVNGVDNGYTSNILTGTITEDLVLTAVFVPCSHTINFKNADGSVVLTTTVANGKTLSSLPTVSRSGYTFVGWIPCAPAVKTDGTVLDSCQYTGDSSSFNALDKKYKYTDKLSLHIEAYMSSWEDIASLKSQIISCTEGGGWGLGYQANTTGHGCELYAGGYKGIDLGFGTAGAFSNKTWYSFDVVFSNGTFEVYLNGTKKGTQTTSNTAISYHSDNTIFVGAEAAKSATTPGGNYFKGYISNVFIANQGTRLEFATTSAVVENSADYYPVWRLNVGSLNEIYIGTTQPSKIYVGTSEVKAVYVGTTKVYG